MSLLWPESRPNRSIYVGSDTSITAKLLFPFTLMWLALVGLVWVFAWLTVWMVKILIWLARAVGEAIHRFRRNWRNHYRDQP